MLSSADIEAPSSGGQLGGARIGDAAADRGAGWLGCLPFRQGPAGPGVKA